MWDTMRDKVNGAAEVEDVRRAALEGHEVQALIGDATDNVPGVPGIGVKTAAHLINEYGDLETLLARAGEIKQQKRRESLITFADQARLSRTLVILDANVPLEVPIEATGVRGARATTLSNFMRKLEFTTLLRRVAEGLGAETAARRSGTASEGHAQARERLRSSIAQDAGGRVRCIPHHRRYRKGRRRLARGARGHARRQLGVTPFNRVQPKTNG